MPPRLNREAPPRQSRRKSPAAEPRHDCWQHWTAETLSPRRGNLNQAGEYALAAGTRGVTQKCAGQSRVPRKMPSTPDRVMRDSRKQDPGQSPVRNYLTLTEGI